MQHVGCHYSAGNSLDFHQMQFPPTAENTPTNATTSTVPQSTTSVLRSWRKKDASEKQSLPTVGSTSAPTEQPNHTNGSTAETQGPVARVAPHNHYPKPPPQSEVYRYPQQYADFGVQGPPQLPTPVKYSEIIEPMHQSIEQLPPIHLHQKQKEKTYLEMCSVQQNHMKPYQDFQNYKPHYEGLKGYNHLPAPGAYNKQYHPHHAPHYALQKESQVPTGYPVQKEGSVPTGNMPPTSHQYLHNYKITPPGNYPRDIRNYPREAPGNEFLANLNKIAPDMAQDIINDPHLRESQFPMYSMEQNRLYPGQPPQQHHHHAHHHQRMYQRTSPIQIQNYPHQRNLQNFNQYPPPINQQRMDPYRMYTPHQRYQQVEQVPSNISPRQYHENVMGFPPRISPNYPPCSQLEYAQHYQHRQVPMRQDFLPIPSKPYIESHPEIPEIVPDDSIHAPKNTLKTFLENWREEFTEEADNNSSEITSSEKIQLVKATSGGPNRENTLYVLDTMEIPSENIPQYLHLQPLEKLPPNIRAFAYNPNEDNARQNAIVISTNMKSEDPNNKTEEANSNSKDVPPYQLFQQNKNYYKNEDLSSHEDRPACKLLQSMANAKNAQLHGRTIMEKQEKHASNFEQNHKQICRSLPELITEDATEEIGKNQEHLHNDYSKIVDSILEENIQGVKVDEVPTGSPVNREEEIEDDQDVGNDVEMAGRKSVIAENQNAIPHEEKVDDEDENKVIEDYGDEERTITKVTNEHLQSEEKETTDNPIDLSQSFEETQDDKLNEDDKTIIEEKSADEDFIQDEETKHVYTDILYYKNDLNSPKPQEDQQQTIIEEDKVTNEDDKATDDVEEEISKTSPIPIDAAEEIIPSETQETKEKDFIPDEVQIDTNQADEVPLKSPAINDVEDEAIALEHDEEITQDDAETLRESENKTLELPEDPDSTNKDVEILQITEDFEEDDATQNQTSDSTEITKDGTPMEIVEEMDESEETVFCEVQEETVVELNMIDEVEENIEDMECSEDNGTTCNEEILPSEGAEEVEEEMDVVTEEIVDVDSVKDMVEGDNEDHSEDDEVSVTEEIEEVEASNEVEVPTSNISDFEDQKPVSTTDETVIEDVNEEILIDKDDMAEDKVIPQEDMVSDKFVEQKQDDSYCDQTCGNEDVIQEETVEENTEELLEDSNTPNDNTDINDSKITASNTAVEIQNEDSSEVKEDFASSFVLEIAKELLQINVIEDDNGEKIISVTPLTKVKVITTETADDCDKNEESFEEDKAEVANNEDENVEDYNTILDEVSLIVSDVIDEVVRIEEEMMDLDGINESEVLVDTVEVEMLVDEEAQHSEESILHSDEHVIDPEIEIHNEIIIDSKEDVEDEIPLDPIENNHEETLVKNHHDEEETNIPTTPPKVLITNNNYIEDISCVKSCDEIREVVVKRSKAVPKLKSNSVKKNLQNRKKKKVKFDLANIKKVETLDQMEKAKIFSSVVVIDKIPDRILAKNHLRKDKTKSNNSKISKKKPKKVRLQEKRFQNNVNFNRFKKRKIELAKEANSRLVKLKESTKKDLKKPGKIEDKVKMSTSIKDKPVAASKIKSIKKINPTEKVEKLLPTPKKEPDTPLPVKISPSMQKEPLVHSEPQKMTVELPKIKDTESEGMPLKAPKFEEPPNHSEPEKIALDTSKIKHSEPEKIAVDASKIKLPLNHLEPEKMTVEAPKLKVPLSHSELEKTTLEPATIKQPMFHPPKSILKHYRHPKDLRRTKSDDHFSSEFLDNFKKRRLSLQEYNNRKKKASSKSEEMKQHQETKVNEENEDKVEKSMVEEVLKSLNSEEMEEKDEGVESQKESPITEAAESALVDNEMITEGIPSSAPSDIEEDLPKTESNHEATSLEAPKIENSTENFEDKPKETIDQSTIEEKVNSLEEFLPKIASTRAEASTTPRRIEESAISRKLDELLAENPISYTQKFNEMALINRFLKREVLTPEELQRVKQIVQYKRAIQSLQKSPVDQSPKRRYSSEFPKSIKIDFRDFDMKKAESSEQSNQTNNKVCYNRSISAFIEEQSKKNNRFRDQFSTRRDEQLPRQSKEDFINLNCKANMTNVNADNQKDAVVEIKDDTSKSNAEVVVKKNEHSPKIRHSILSIISSPKKSVCNVENHDEKTPNPVLKHAIQNLIKPEERSTKVSGGLTPKNDACLSGVSQLKDEGKVVKQQPSNAVENPKIGKQDLQSPQRKSHGDLNLPVVEDKNADAVTKLIKPIAPSDLANHQAKVVKSEGLDKGPVKSDAKSAEKPTMKDLVDKQIRKEDSPKVVSKTKAQLKCFQEINVHPIMPKPIDAKDQQNPVISNLTKLTALLNYYKKGLENGDGTENFKRIEEIIDRLSPNLKNLPNLSDVNQSNEYEVSKKAPETKLKLHLKKKSQNPSDNKKKRKRFRNLYTENESDEDAPKPKEAKTEKSGGGGGVDIDYSVYQRKSPAGVPKLVIKRRKSDIKNSLQPYVKINRLASIETMVKRRKKSIFLSQGPVVE